MFKSNENVSPHCSKPEEIVAYIYDELKPAGRQSFELHLADCDHCTSELADLSIARLDVYEWHRDEFLALETPEIVVPYAQEVRVSWVESVRAFFAAQSRLAFAGGAFGLLAIALAGAYLAVRPVPGDLAMDNTVTQPKAERTLSASDPAPDPQPAAAPKKADNDQSSSGEMNVPRPMRASSPERKQPVARRPSASKPRPGAERPLQTRTAAPPRLNDFDDEEDTTLRLGDLMAEIDARD
jgi:hypothetical protein